jgi:RNA polymerase sigma factor (TIGR02999 family)
VRLIGGFGACAGNYLGLAERSVDSATRRSEEDHFSLEGSETVRYRSCLGLGQALAARFALDMETSGTSPSSDVTRLLVAIGAGDLRASDELLPLVYGELRKLAAQRLRREQPGQTLDATALVHEAYLRLVGDGSPIWSTKGHFFGAAALAMRRILVERARRVDRERHGGTRQRISLSEVMQREGLVGQRIESSGQDRSADNRIDLVALDGALRRMEEEDERMARIVMLRFFAGLSIEQTAEALDLSPTTVKRQWACARAWLFDELKHPHA